MAMISFDSLSIACCMSTGPCPGAHLERGAYQMEVRQIFSWSRERRLVLAANGHQLAMRQGTSILPPCQNGIQGFPIQPRKDSAHCNVSGNPTRQDRKLGQPQRVEFAKILKGHDTVAAPQTCASKDRVRKTSKFFALGAF